MTKTKIPDLYQLEPEEIEYLDQDVDRFRRKCIDLCHPHHEATIQHLIEQHDMQQL